MLLLAAMALVVGTGGAFGAWALLKLIDLVINIAWFGELSARSRVLSDAAMGMATILTPVAGSLIIGLTARFGSEKIRGHGIPEAIEAILFGESRLSAKVAVLKPLSSAISIGTGGPFGAEGPIIMTGGAMGSLFAQCFHLSAAERKTLLVAGAGAGMTAIFGTPVAAILLALEVLLFEWKPRSFVPLVAAVLVAFAWRPLLIGSGPLFPFEGGAVLDWWMLPAAIGVGLAGGLQSAFLSKALYRIEDLFHHLPIHWMWWPALGAVAVGIGGLVEPRVLGAGYNSIQDLLNGALAMRAVALLLVTKAIVWMIALGSGTSGGVLAPLLILGGAMGCLAGQFLPGGAGLWTLLGMASVMSGSMRAPLTGAIFAVELTGHYVALPLTIAAAVSAYAVTVLLIDRSILTEKIARRGRHIIQEYSVDPFDVVQLSQIMTRNPETLGSTMRIDEAIAFFAQDAKHKSYPVVDGLGQPVGMVERADILRWRVEGTDLEDTLGDRISDRSLPAVFDDATCGSAADLMVDLGIGRLCVMDRADRKLIGLVSRSDLLRARGGQQQIERERTRFLDVRRLRPASLADENG